MKRLLFLIIFLFTITCINAQNRVSTYIDWTLYGTGASQKVYDSPSFYWKVMRESQTTYNGYYVFYLYLYSNSGQTVYDYSQARIQKSTQVQIEYEKRPTEFYDFQISVSMEQNTQRVSVGQPFWWLANWDTGEPIRFEVNYANPYIHLSWKNLRVY